MNHPASISDFGVKVLGLLTEQVSCATSEQLLKRGQQLGVSRRAAQETLRRLRREGMATAKRAIVRQVPIEKPLRCFTSAETPDDLGRLASHLCRRWQRARQSRPMVYRATSKAVGLFGAAVTTRADSHKTDHDLVLTEVLLRYLQSDPKPAWFHEASLDRLELIHSGLKPDAVVWPKQADSPRAIEVGGQYSKQRLTQLHRAMADSNMEWELW